MTDCTIVDLAFATVCFSFAALILTLSAGMVAVGIASFLEIRKELKDERTEK